VKLKYAFGVLALLLLMVGTASAYTLGNSNSPDALKDVSVGASVSGNVVTFEVTKEDNTITDVWIKDVGLPTTVSVANSGAVTDGDGNSLKYTVSKKDQTMAGFLVVKVALPGGENKGASTVEITYDGNLPSDPVFVAHACWAPWIEGQYDDNGNQLTSAMFYNSETTQIPEFPTMALPVAAILGLMFIFGRRKQE
jgi:hypothetical protein